MTTTDACGNIVNGEPVETTYLGRAETSAVRRFALGMLHALALGADWVWLADDDGEPFQFRSAHTAGLCIERRLAEVSPMVCDMADPQRLAFPLRRGLVWRRRVSELRTGTGITAGDRIAIQRSAVARRRLTRSVFLISGFCAP